MHWVYVHPLRVEKKLGGGVIYRGKFQVHPQAEQEVTNFRALFWCVGEIWSVGAVNRVALAFVLSAATKEKSSTFSRKSALQRKSWLRLWYTHYIVLNSIL